MAFFLFEEESLVCERVYFDAATILSQLGLVQPAPAPRFSATAGRIRGPAPAIGADNAAALESWGFSSDEVAALTRSGAL